MKFSFFLVLIFSLAFTGCSGLNSLKELKNDVVGSLNFNDNKSRNKKQLNYQLSKYQNNFSAGKIVPLYSSLFDRSNGSTGLWVPMQFVDEIGGGLYFTKAYDPNKIPILFVHGAGGNPREWLNIIRSLDKKFQPVVAFYPSGMRLEHSAKVIHGAIQKIFTQYKPEYMPIVAHSMGGLIMKKAIDLMDEKELNRVRNFITISSPWGGDGLAKKSGSLDYSLPYWVDMKPTSDFLYYLHKKPLSKRIKHYLLFGYNGKLTLTKGTSNDGVVTLKSQLHYKRQEQAHKVLGFNENHTSILRSKKLIRKLNQIVLLK